MLIVKFRSPSKVVIAGDDLSKMNSFFCASDNVDADVANVVDVATATNVVDVASIATTDNVVDVDVANFAVVYNFGVKGYDSCSLKILG